MDLQITGRVVELLEEQSGEGKNGTWRKQEFILQTDGQYPKQVCIVQWGDKIDQWGVEPGEMITAHINIESREWNGRWYTDVKAWRIDRPQGEAGAGPPSASDEPWPDSPPDFSGEDDGLPF